MDGERFDQITKRLVSPASRRRALTILGSGMLAILPPALARRGLATVGAQKCRRPQQPCKRTSQCCGKRSKCGFSHGGGTAVRTCCGKVGAPCPGNALGCCIPLVCGADNRCVEP
jgi:hypothetical protein